MSADYTLRVRRVPLNSPRSRVWRGGDMLWHVVLWGDGGTWARFGSWDRALDYATTGRLYA